jgi:osmoprotectant transport system permease protein
VEVIGQAIGWLSDPAHWQGPNGILVRLVEHVALSGVALAVAALIALPAGAWIGHTGRLTRLAVNAANIWRALPSLAVIALVLPLTAMIDPQAGFRLYPTLVAMVVLALPPMLVNTYSGISGVERELVEAARGQGFAEAQLLARVELPLALPVIATGIRSGAVQVIATATLGAIFGFGGLGRYLVDGIAQRDAGQLLGGVILVAALVIGVDALFALLQRQLTPRPLRGA